MAFVHARSLQTEQQHAPSILESWVLGLLVKKDRWERNHPLPTRQDTRTPVQLDVHELAPRRHEVHNMIKPLASMYSMRACNLGIRNTARPTPNCSLGVPPPRLSAC